MTVYEYAGQYPMDIATVYNTGIVDLSSQANINGNATTYVWKTESGITLVNGSDYSISGGITTFLKKQTEKVYCEMTNATFPAFTSSAPLKTTLTTVSVNEAPVINNQTFSVLEGSANGTFVGKVIASDPDVLNYSIISGNTSDAFAINSSTGDITVKTSTVLDYEALSTYALTVKVQDNGTGALSGSATITINLTDKNETPNISNQSFSVIEASPNGTVIGKIIASDPDADVLTYSIVSGNTSDAFAVNATTGTITVNTSTALNYEMVSSYALTIKVQDNGALSNSATITINLIDKNEAPIINDHTFSIKESSTNGAVVGTVSASDPDGDLLTYSIVSGNNSDVFAINAATGVLTVKTASALNCESLPSYALTIKVQDNGVGTLSNSATITINLTDKNQTPLISDQTFSISEKISNGSIVGKVLASDPDGGTLTYSIISGNTSDAFAINAATGEITVKTSTALSYKSLSSYSLSVKVQDNGVGTLSNSAVITINLTGTTGIYSVYSGKANCVYPNPSKGVININPDLLSKNDLKFKVIDLNGKVVLEKTNISPGESFAINQSGLFIIILSVNNEEFRQKIIVQK
jgi:c-di-GMP-binding flagellar brake protein YcgR